MLTDHTLSRRGVLEMSAALAGFIMATPVASALAQSRLAKTPDGNLGPFYPLTKPLETGADLTVGKIGQAQGQIIDLTGRVLNLRGEPVPGARVELWQANTHGRYTHPSDRNTAPLDPNFTGYGAQVTDAEGRYRFKTVKPGAYPTPYPGWSRPPHIHFDVTARTDRLVTQIFFDGDPLNDQDRLLQSSPARELLLVKLAPAAERGALAAVWDIVLPQG